MWAINSKMESKALSTRAVNKLLLLLMLRLTMVV